MTQIHFYHLTTTPLERALPKLLEKAHAAGMRAQVLTASDEQTEHLNQLLWTYDPASFLPHGSLRDDAPERQPIFLDSGEENRNAASLLCVLNGTAPGAPEAYARILDLFDGGNAEAVEKARARWKAYKEAGHEIAYMKQSESGGWVKAA